MTGAPADQAFVWREAQAALLDHLRRQDPPHALRRVARSLAQAAGRPVALVAAGGDPAACWLGGPGARREALQAGGWCLALTRTGLAVGQLWLDPQPVPADREALLRTLDPLIETAAELLATLLEAQDPRSPPRWPWSRRPSARPAPTSGSGTCALMCWATSTKAR